MLSRVLRTRTGQTSATWRQNQYVDPMTLAIGWDVGGWLGHKQAAAAISVEADGSWRHVGQARAFAVKEILAGGIEALARVAWPDAPSEALAGRIVIAIDAPLCFPRAFELFVSGQTAIEIGWSREIENPLAYRECDRYVAKEHGKKPLSASFDKLGNNATVAMALTRRWRDHEGFRVLPFDELGDGRRVVIETYPALFKREGVVVERARSLLPDGLVDGSDEKDATICALVAAAYANASNPRLPHIVGPVAAGCDGWIFAPSREWMESPQGDERHGPAAITPGRGHEKA